jgi:hypothetical protein
MKLTDTELAQRLPVWVALAGMFLNADVALTRGARVQALAASPYPAEVLAQILMDEVYPVCWASLNAAQGEALNFPPDRLAVAILGMDPASPTVMRLRELARLAVPHSSEWQSTLADVAVLRAASAVVEQGVAQGGVNG